MENLDVPFSLPFSLPPFRSSIQAATGEIIEHRHDRFYGAGITAVAFFPDGKRVVIADGEALVRVFDLNTGKEVARHERVEPWLSVLAVATSPDGRHVLLASHPHPMLWNLQTGRLLELPGHTYVHPNMQGEPGGVHSVAFSPDGKLAITGGEDGTIRFWPVPQEAGQ